MFLLFPLLLYLDKVLAAENHDVQVEFVSVIQRPSWLRHHGFRVSSSNTRTTLPDQTGKCMRGVLEAYSIRILPFEVIQICGFSISMILLM